MGNKAEMLTASDFRRPGKERRREPRLECRKRIRLLPCLARSQWSFLSAELLDCSCHGLSVLVETEMTPGEHFLVPLKIGTVKLLIYEVRSCTNERGRSYRIGAEFSGFTATQCAESPAVILESLLAAEDLTALPH